MNLSDKKILFLGDSITEGVGVSDPSNKYVNVFQRLSGAEVYNYGISGTRIAEKRTPTVDHLNFDRSFVSRVEEMDAEADAVVVFGGTNDFGHGDAPLGIFSDRDVYTFYGALHTLILKLVNKYPTAKIVFMTPLHRLSEDITVSEIGLPRVRLIEYVRAIRNVCEFYSIPVLDLYRESGLQPRIPVIKEKFMPDGLHPSDAGAKIIAEKLYSFLQTI